MELSKETMEQLSDAIADNLMQSVLYTGNVFGSEWVEHEGMILLNTHIASGDMNGVFHRYPLQKHALENVPYAMEYFKQNQLPFYWWVFKNNHQDKFIEILKYFGFHFLVDLPVMYAPLHDLPEYRCPENIHCKRVENREELMDWIRLSALCIELEHTAVQEYENFCLQFDLQDVGHQELYLGYLDNEPVASCMTFKSLGMAGLYFIAVEPDKRSKGVGLAITRYAMEQARREGFAYAGLQSTALGLPLYIKAGFRIIDQVLIYGLDQ